jgi:hypothetical protein
LVAGILKNQEPAARLALFDPITAKTSRKTA